MSPDKNRPETWVRYKPSLCSGCHADCCAMILEVRLTDLVRLGLAQEDEAPKKAFKRLQKEGIARSYREGTGLFELHSKANDDCQFLDSRTRLCTVYDKRPEVCRRFPVHGLRPSYCPRRPVELR